MGTDRLSIYSNGRRNDEVMDIAETVLNFFHKNFTKTIDKEQEELIQKAFRKESFQKKQLIFRNGDSNTKHYFIEKGLVRLYLIDSDGKEFNILFAKENQVIGDLSTPEPTEFNLESIERTTAWSIHETALQKLIMSVHPGGFANRDTTLRRSYIHMQKRLTAILSNTAEVNYLEFRKQYPDFIQRLPQYHIASYLGISPEFLSKIIARTSKK